MSQVLWSKNLVPDESLSASSVNYDVFGESFKLDQVIRFPATERDLVNLPDRRAYRAMSRAAVLLAAVGLEAKEVIANQLAEDPFSVGLYCAVDNGPDDYECVKTVLDTPDDEFAAAYKKARSPKQYLKQLPNLAPAQLGIFLDIRGPLNVYIHSKVGSIQALDQAEQDLKNGVVKMALVCSSFSLEDPLLALRVKRDQTNSKVICEGAAALILSAGGEDRDWSLLQTSNENQTKTYGIADPLINYNTGLIQ